MTEPGPEAALAEMIAALEDYRNSAVTPPDRAQPLETEPNGLPALCPLCRLADRSAERSLRAFFSEFVNDPQVRIQFRKSRGFCREHLPLLARCGDALGVAILYADLADETRQRWRASGSTPKASLFSRWFQPAKESVCPACAAEAEAETRYAAAFADGLARNPAVWELLQTGPGFCVRHVERIASAARPADAVKLLEIERARLDSLFGELEEFVRKNDYRFRGEPWGAERDAWRRALLRLRR